jgi:hypothetical protein
MTQLFSHLKTDHSVVLKMGRCSMTTEKEGNLGSFCGTEEQTHARKTSSRKCDVEREGNLELWFLENKITNNAIL